jgi:hypothetical protein
MIVHDSAISICYAMLCYAAVATVAAAVAVAGCNERESWLLCGVSACVCGCECASSII